MRPAPLNTVQDFFDLLRQLTQAEGFGQEVKIILSRGFLKGILCIA